MKKRILKITGISVVIFTLCANLQYALFNYGMKDGKLSMAVLAQTGSDGTSTGGDTETGTNTGLFQKRELTGNTCETTTTVKLTIGFAEVTRSIKYAGKYAKCVSGGLVCVPKCEATSAISTSDVTNTNN